MGHLASSLAPTAAVLPFAGVSAPKGWLLCDGRSISRETYASLFEAIGTMYGSGDGETTFNLPDYRWTFLRGCGPNLTATGSGVASTLAENFATFNTHGFNRNGIKVRRLSGTLSNLAANTDYYTVLNPDDPNLLGFAISKANALNGIRVTLSGSNTAVIGQWEDPDASGRGANAWGANSAANVGSVQTDGFKNHGHTISGGSGVNFPVSVATAFGGAGTYGVTAGSGSTQLPYGNSVIKADLTNTTPETRPSNISVNYIIKI
jgi:microcystin-dependent protein